MTPEEIEKKGRVIRHLIEAVELHYQKFQEPIPMRVIAARFGKALEKLGGFTETVNMLDADGSIEVLYERGGRRLIYPTGRRPAQKGGAA